MNEEDESEVVYVEVQQVKYAILLWDIVVSCFIVFGVGTWIGEVAILFILFSSLVAIGVAHFGKAEDAIVAYDGWFPLLVTLLGTLFYIGALLYVGEYLICAILFLTESYILVYNSYISLDEEEDEENE